MNAAEITQRVKLDLDKQVLFDKKIADGYYFCPRRDPKGRKHGSKFIKREGHSFYCGHKDKKNIMCFYHFTGNKGRR